jgi:hypothetical protein
MYLYEQRPAGANLNKKEFSKLMNNIFKDEKEFLEEFNEKRSNLKFDNFKSLLKKHNKLKESN